MGGFKATEAVEELTYDFRPHADVHGTIAEPSSKQIEKFRDAVFGSIKGLGLSPDQIAEDAVTFDMIDGLMEKSGKVEQDVARAVARLTGIDFEVLDGLPYRVKAAFVGWIMGQFLSPEA